MDCPIFVISLKISNFVNFMKTAITELLGIEKPLFQGGMAWIADARLAAAVSNAGGLGLISSINAGTEAVRKEIRLARELTRKPFGVNIMLAAPNAADIAALVVEEGVSIVTTGAGSPAPYMEAWKAAGIRVIPVVASVATPARCRSWAQPLS
jgi:enoyl-[acyl-carrier protein] reductase II